MTEFVLIMPELFLALTLGFVVIGEITYHEEQFRLIGATALMGLAGAFLQTVMTYQYGVSQIFNQSLSVDGLSLFFKLLSIVLAALAIIASFHSKEIPNRKRSEYYALVLSFCLAMCLSSSATDLLLVFLSLQFLNILAFFIAGYNKRSKASTEAAVKFMIMSAVAGFFLLYGLSILFAHTRTLNIYEMHRVLMATPLSAEVMLVALTLIFLSIAFQVGAFPMHFWAPDVLEGASTSSSAFLFLGTRMAATAVTIRLLIAVFSQPSGIPGNWKVLGSVDWTQILSVISSFTMLIGSFLAIRQQGAKRLVACLAVAQTGHLLLGILVLDQVGLSALLYNLVIELFSLVGVFYVLSYFRDELHSDRLKDLRGAMGRAVPECICLIIFLLCLIGVPPLPGFIGKFTLIGAVVRHQFLGIAAITIGSLVLSAVAASRLIYCTIGDVRETISTPFSPSKERQLFLAGLLVPIVLVGVLADNVIGWAGRSLSFILW